MALLAFIYKENDTLIFKPKENDSKDYYALFFIVVSYVLSHYLKISEFPIWLDEYTQFHNSTRPLVKSLIDSAFYEQQPPLDYVLTGFSVFLFGETEFALKFHTLLFGLLFFIHLPIFIKDLGVNRRLSYVTTLILIWSPPLLGYSLEARPLMLCLFWGLLFLCSLRRFIKEPSKENFIYLTLNQLLLTLTTSLQPQIFIFTAFICTLIFFQKDRSAIKKILFTNFITLIYTTPTLYYVITLVDETNQIVDSSFHNFLLLFNIYNAEEVIKILTCSPYILCTLGFLTLLRIAFWSKRRPSSDFLFYSSFSILFYFFYLSIYYSFISWHFAFRYAFLFYIPFLASSLLAIKELNDILPRATRKIFLSVILLIGLIGVYKSVKLPINSRISALSRTDWRSLYSFLHNNLKEEDLVVRLNFDTIGEWRGGLWVSSRIYLHDEHRTKLLDTHDFFPQNSNAVFIDKDLNYSSKTQGKVYIVNEITRMHPNWYKNSPIDGLKRVYKSPLLEVFIMPIEDNLFKTFKIYFLKVIEKLGRDQESTVAAWESLLALEFIYGEEDSFKKYLQQYKEIKPKNHWTRDGVILDKNKVLEDRVRFLESLVPEFEKYQRKHRATLGF